ncbi:hypothetical protein XELAEV_18045521mg [Xenopus laevis]|nr:hypothetical protein XELAEV_18045521mg [Xenopus laevis]
MAAPMDSAEETCTREPAGLRRRKKEPVSEANATTAPESREEAECEVSLLPRSFWLTRIVLLRAIAAIYFVAFLVAFHQNKQLIGDRGLLPCKLYLKNIKQYFGGKIGLEAVSHAPTLLWLLDWSRMDTHLDNIALVGLAISFFILVTGCSNMIFMVTLWILYHSLVAVGQIW